MENQEWGYGFDMEEIAPGQWQSSYWLISPSGDVTERRKMPIRTVQASSLDEAQAAGIAEASRRNKQPDTPIESSSAPN